MHRTRVDCYNIWHRSAAVVIGRLAAAAALLIVPIVALPIHMIEGAIVIPVPSGNGAWTQVASTCTVDPGSAPHDTIGAGLSFAGSSTGEIIARCNVTNLVHLREDDEVRRDWDAFEVVYSDPDWRASDSQIVATLHEVGADGLAEQLVVTRDPITGRPRSLIDPSEIVRFDSNAEGPAAAVVRTGRVRVSHEFNFLENSYYVLLRIRRVNSALGNRPTVYAVRLWRHIP